MSDISRYTTSDVTKPARSDVSRITRSDVTRATRSDVTKTSQKASFPALARHLLGPEKTSTQKARLTVSRWKGRGAGFGQFIGGEDRLAKTVNALRAAVRFKGPGDADSCPNDQHPLDPEPDHRFQADKVKKLLEAILEDKLEGFRYESGTAAKLVQDLSQQITDEVKAFEFPRYKLVSNVLLGQVGGQNLQVSTRCLWNTYSDSYACATHKTPTYFVVALVHATYFE